MDQARIKHLEFIQNIIARMNSNSFQIKNWSVVIISAILTISISRDSFYILLVALLPIVLFWCLDAYYLTQERRFRELYKEAANTETELKLFAMDISPFKKRGASLSKSFNFKNYLLFLHWYGINNHGYILFNSMCQEVSDEKSIF